MDNAIAQWAKAIAFETVTWLVALVLVVGLLLTVGWLLGTPWPGIIAYVAAVILRDAWKRVRGAR